MDGALLGFLPGGPRDSEDTAVAGTELLSRHTRLPLRVPAVSESLGAAGDPEMGETENLSQTGMLLRLPTDALVPGAPIRVTLRLHRRSPLTLTGRVAWVRPHPDLRGWAVGIQLGEHLSEEMVIEIADEEYPPWGAPR